MTRKSAYSLCFLACLGLVPAAASAVPGAPMLIEHSGRLLDSNDQPAEGSFKLKFAIYTVALDVDATQPSAPLWTGTYTGVQVTKGFYTVELGSTAEAPIPATLFDGSGARWLAINVDDRGEFKPRLRLASVPHALLANTAVDAAALGGMPPSFYSDAGNLTGTLPSSVFALAAGAGVSITGTANAPKIGVTFGQTSGTVVEGDDPRLSSNAGILTGTLPASVFTLSAGTGATIGGTANAPQVNVTFGNVAGTVAEGSDPRFTDARAPTPGSTSYIQNQAGSPQSADLNISGKALIGGNVGIGTSAPLAKLHVSGAYPQLLLDNPASGAGDMISFADAGIVRQQIGHINTTGGFQIATGGTNAAAAGIAPRLTVVADGKVGIGTTTPTTLLDVAGTIRSTAVVVGDSSPITVAQTTGQATFEYPYQYTITVGGDANTFYPVAMMSAANGTVPGKFVIARGYSEAGPTGLAGQPSTAHKGGLQAVFTTMNTAWADYHYLTVQAHVATYVRTIGDCGMLPAATDGRALWCRLRGGGFVYRVYANYAMAPNQPTPGSIAYNVAPYQFNYPATLALASLPTTNAFAGNVIVPVSGY